MNVTKIILTLLIVSSLISPTLLMGTLSTQWIPAIYNVTTKKYLVNTSYRGSLVLCAYSLERKTICIMTYEGKKISLSDIEFDKKYGIIKYETCSWFGVCKETGIKVVSK